MPVAKQPISHAVNASSANSQQIDRIGNAFSRAAAEGRSCFVAYICAGDPTPEDSEVVCRTILECGTDILEIGVPFSDPLADGLTNQLAAQRALDAGMTAERVFALVREIRRHSDAAIIFYTYYNLLLAHGMDDYCQRAREAGVDGILTLDCPPEEAGEFLAATRRHGLKAIFIVAPTTPDERIPVITKDASGFIYYVSREGVTGERAELAANLDSAVSRIKAHTDLPVVVGFGISTPAHVKAVAAIADGVVVGSALVNVSANLAGQPDVIRTKLREKMEYLLGTERVNLRK